MHYFINFPWFQMFELMNELKNVYKLNEIIFWEIHSKEDQRDEFFSESSYFIN